MNPSETSYGLSAGPARGSLSQREPALCDLGSDRRWDMLQAIEEGTKKITRCESMSKGNFEWGLQPAIALRQTAETSKFASTEEDLIFPLACSPAFWLFLLLCFQAKDRRTNTIKEKELFKCGKERNFVSISAHLSAQMD